MTTLNTLDVLCDQALVDEYLQWGEHRKGLRPLTIRMYRSTLGHFVTWCGHTALVDLTAEDLEDFSRRDLVHGGTPSASTARRELVTVCKFFDWVAARKGLPLAAHRIAVAPKIQPGVPKPVPDEHWVALWEGDLDPQDRLWLGLAYFCGFRRFELVTVAPSAFNTDTQLCVFERKGGKESALPYAALPRAVELKLPWLTVGWADWVNLLETTTRTRAAAPHLCTYATADDPFLDGNRLSKALTRLLVKRGVPKFTPHQLRHSFATNLFRSGVEASVIQGFMSHASQDTTKGYVDQSGHLERWIIEREGHA